MEIIFFAAIFVLFVLINTENAIFGPGRTISKDKTTYHSKRHGLTVRPDLVMKMGQKIIPYEYKNTVTVFDNQIAKLATAFIVLEDALNTKIDYGYIVNRHGKQIKIKNTKELRQQVLKARDEIIEIDRQFYVLPKSIGATPNKCLVCGFRNICKKNLTQ